MWDRLLGGLYKSMDKKDTIGGKFYMKDKLVLEKKVSNIYTKEIQTNLENTLEIFKKYKKENPKYSVLISELLTEIKKYVFWMDKHYPPLSCEKDVLTELTDCLALFEESIQQVKILVNSAKHIEDSKNKATNLTKLYWLKTYGISEKDLKETQKVIQDGGQPDFEPLNNEVRQATANKNTATQKDKQRWVARRAYQLQKERNIQLKEAYGEAAKEWEDKNK